MTRLRPELFRRVRQPSGVVTEPLPVPDQVPDVSAEDERAALLSSYTSEGITEERLRQLVRGRPVDEDQAFSDAIPRLAAENGMTPAEVARELAEARVLAQRYAAFLDDHGISQHGGRDERVVAEETLRAVTRRRDRLEAQKRNPIYESRLPRIEQELERLDRAESEAFSFLHEPYFGSVFGKEPPGRQREVGGWPEPQPRQEVFDCRCGGRMSRQEWKAVNRCTTCVGQAKLLGVELNRIG